MNKLVQKYILISLLVTVSIFVATFSYIYYTASPEEKKVETMPASELEFKMRDTREKTDVPYKTPMGETFEGICSSTSRVLDFVKEEFSVDEMYIQAQGYSSLTGFRFRELDPVMFLTSNDAVYVDVISDSNWQDYFNRIFKGLTERGFTYRGESYYETISVRFLVFQNGQEIINVAVPQVEDDIDEIEISCIVADESAAGMSDIKDIIDASRTTSEEGSQSVPYDVLTTIQVVDVGEDGYRLSIGSLSSGGGHADWWGKVQGKWKHVFTSQDSVPCSAFENENVGRGISCSGCSDGLGDDSACESGFIERNVTY